MKLLHSLKKWLSLPLFLLSMIIILGGCATSGAGSSSVPTTSAAQPSATPSSLANCQTQQLLLVEDRGGVAGGNAGLGFHFENQAKVACTLLGYPTLQLLNAQHQPMTQYTFEQSTSAYTYLTHAPALLTLRPQEKAYFAIDWADDCNGFPKASFLQVTPPGNQKPMLMT